MTFLYKQVCLKAALPVLAWFLLKELHYTTTHPPCTWKFVTHDYLPRPKKSRDSSTTNLSHISMLTQPLFTSSFWTHPLLKSSSTHPPNSAFSILLSVINVGCYQSTRNCLHLLVANHSAIADLPSRSRRSRIPVLLAEAKRQFSLRYGKGIETEVERIYVLHGIFREDPSRNTDTSVVSNGC